VWVTGCDIEILDEEKSAPRKEVTSFTTILPANDPFNGPIQPANQPLVYVSMKAASFWLFETGTARVEVQLTTKSGPRYLVHPQDPPGMWNPDFNISQYFASEAKTAFETLYGSPHRRQGLGPFQGRRLGRFLLSECAGDPISTVALN
jgi:hypothetical protein